MRRGPLGPTVPTRTLLNGGAGEARIRHQGRLRGEADSQSPAVFLTRQSSNRAIELRTRAAVHRTTLSPRHLRTSRKCRKVSPCPGPRVHQPGPQLYQSKVPVGVVQGIVGPHAAMSSTTMVPAL